MNIFIIASMTNSGNRVAKRLADELNIPVIFGSSLLKKFKQEMMTAKIPEKRRFLKGTYTDHMEYYYLKMIKYNWPDEFIFVGTRATKLFFLFLLCSKEIFGKKMDYIVHLYDSSKWDESFEEESFYDVLYDILPKGLIESDLTKPTKRIVDEILREMKV